MASKPELEKHLFVDGYNIIHAWPELKQALGDYGWQAATTRLVEMVRILHDILGIQVTVVFDGQGPKVEMDRPTKEVYFSVLYSCSGLTADGLIEQLVRKASKHKKHLEVLVATQDALLCQTVQAVGAYTLSPSELLSWVGRTHERQSRYLPKGPKGFSLF